jgi:hypothetical protein
MHIADSRRYAHLVLLLLMIIGIRAYGGPTQAEDRLASVTRWTAEKAGLSAAKQTLDTKVRPRMAQANGSINSTIYAVSSQIMNNLETAVNGTAGWAWQQVRNAGDAIDVGIRSVLNPNAPAQPERADIVPQDDAAKTNPAR